MSDIKVIDNLLSSFDLQGVQDLFSPSFSQPPPEIKKDIGEIPWIFSLVNDPRLFQGLVKNTNEDPSYRFQLSHMIYHATSPSIGIDPIVTQAAHFIIPIFFSKIKSPSILRIKSNLQLKTTEIETNPFHTDYRSEDKDVNQYESLKTSIFYINSNDGYTEFEDGTKIESVANRLITFPSYMEHRGTSCTDKPFRLVINFNYF